AQFAKILPQVCHAKDFAGFFLDSIHAVFPNEFENGAASTSHVVIMLWIIYKDAGCIANIVRIVAALCGVNDRHGWNRSPVFVPFAGNAFAKHSALIPTS